jgi:CheY-like chemotaxis protein
MAKKILLVDDSVDIREVYQQILEGVGYQVTTAASGEEAFARAKAERFDLILSDVVMPGMDGLDLVSHLRSDLPPPLPPIILWSGFDITEAEALRRGALMFVRKPVTQEDVLDFVVFGLRRERIDPVARAKQRARSTSARQRARDTAIDLLARLDADALRRRTAGQLRWLRSYFGVSTAMSVILRGEQLVVLDADGQAPWQPGVDVSAHLVYGFEIIETGASLVLPDAATHPSFVTAGGVLEGIRFFAGVPLIGPEGVTVGVACLFDGSPRMFQAEDLLILEQVGRRASELIDALVAGRPTEQGWSTSPGMAIASTFEWLLDVELRLLARYGGSLELAVVELADPVRISEVLAHGSDRERLAGGVLAPNRGAVFKRDRGSGSARVMDELFRSLAAKSIHHVAGIVSVADPDTARIGASGLIRIASLALERALQSDGGMRRVVFRSERCV